MEGNNMDVYKAYIRNTNSLKDLAFSSLFSEGNELNLGPILSFLLILTAVEKLLIICIYIFIYKLCVYIVSNIAILAISTALAKIY
jgi:hypothetical protein